MLLTRSPRLRVAISVVLDVIATALALAFAILIRHRLGGWSFSTPHGYAVVFGILIAAQAVLLSALGCYARHTLRSILIRVGGALVLSHLLLAMIAFYAKVHFLSRGVVAFLLPLNYVLILVLRVGLVRLIFGNTKPRVLVVGSDKGAVSLAQALSGQDGYEVLGHVGPGGGDARPILAPAEEIGRILGEYAPVDIVAIPAGSDKRVVKHVYEVCRERGAEIVHMMTPHEGFDGEMSVEAVGDSYALVERAR